MLQVVVLTMTLFLSNNQVTTRAFVSTQASLEDCETQKNEAITNLTGVDVTAPGGEKVTIRYVDGFCRVVSEGRNI